MNDENWIELKENTQICLNSKLKQIKIGFHGTSKPKDSG